MMTRRGAPAGTGGGASDRPAFSDRPRVANPAVEAATNCLRLSRLSPLFDFNGQPSNSRFGNFPEAGSPSEARLYSEALSCKQYQHQPVARPFSRIRAEPIFLPRNPH